MRTCSATLAALLTIGCAYHNPDAPSPVPPISPAAPYTLTLGATVGMGADAGRATVTAKVQNVNGEALQGVTVQFSTDAGILSATTVATGSSGMATTTLVSASSASITATVGSLRTQTLVASQPSVVLPVPREGGPEPTPLPVPPPVLPLGVTLTTPEAVKVGTQTLFSANITNGPAISFVWTFGDGETFSGASPTTAHIYGAVGSYSVGVTVTDALLRTASASTTATVNAIPPEPTPTPVGPSYSVTLAASPSTVFVGNSSMLTASVVPSNGATAPTGYAWDCFNNGTVVTTTGNTHPCIYPSAGTITSVVTVSGSASASASIIVTVTVPPPPTVTINCSSGGKVAPPVPTTCVASATVNGAAVPSASITPVVWDFGDGTPLVTTPTNNSGPHQYTSANPFTVFGTATIAGVTGTVIGSTTTTIVP